MKPTVHILAYVRKAELLPAALLTLRSIRVGFPASPVMVWGNALKPEFEAVVAAAAHQAGANFVNITGTSHDAWIESLILESLQPFWIVDSDVVFWDDIEERSSKLGVGRAEFKGRFEPAFREPFTNTAHVERLHPCVMYIDPAATRAAMRKFMATIPEHFRDSAQFPMVRQTYVGVRNAQTVFYDTMAGLYQCGAGAAFTEEENDCFDHLNCGSYVDLISPVLADGHLEGTLQDIHRLALANPEVLRGARHQQAKFYEEHRLEPTRTTTRTAKKPKENLCHGHQV